MEERDHHEEGALPLLTFVLACIILWCNLASALFYFYLCFSFQEAEKRSQSNGNPSTVSTIL